MEWSVVLACLSFVVVAGALILLVLMDRDTTRLMRENYTLRKMLEDMVNQEVLNSQTMNKLIQELANQKVSRPPINGSARYRKPDDKA